ncbi:dihydrofolate reductase [Lactiplantibacillus fabifermentans]|uniref:Dihydrofolate reductase n=2 Tax=Lactiplantibacillus fabifermentans TaxID=483011 RepID=A0A0R2NCY0_9LACO|nr:dihydrofolate reductase [Lactiplantibacillus fabifermentans]ETY74224.1 dihydrofolate reductase [Lactiplantibacillus fabifermentans T30PCM01]KRO23700.1 dihydrofolate reductase [Lactiplantibacillus fabifermentans DSM 21115]
MIALIWAQDQNGLIGNAGQLPWHLPADLKRFKQLTLDHKIVMGHTTFAGFKKPLPHRENMVLSRQDLTLPAGVEQLHSIDELWALDAARPNEMIFVIGGSQVFEAVLPKADRLYRTIIDDTFSGDTWMPTIDYTNWHLVDRQAGVTDVKNPYRFQFEDYVRG